MLSSVATGISACTAASSIDRISPPDSATTQPPTRTPRLRSATSLMTPSSLASQPRAPRSPVETATSRPASRAAFSLRPTDATSGAVNVTRGTAR